MSELSVADAAQRLQVSPRRVRALLEGGHLNGRQIAGRWLVSLNDVERRQNAAPAAGRPLSPASAWHVLAVLAGIDDALATLPPPTRSRARARARELRHLEHAEAVRQWRSALRNRARQYLFYAHPSVLHEFLNQSKVIPSGISAAHEHGADLMVLGGAEGYVRAQDLPHLQERYALNPDAGADSNVRLHVVDGVGDWLFKHRPAPAAVVAADLIEHDEPRDQSAGAQLAAQL
ncbi:helix-turn-helix domain-containing protein [Planosporangium flavigriseum]|uniref:Helix-turn-helix domain-containing protein n=1 Tax=Planosporangium flavigriseum TaxID=373681 RepID=A0A8J3PLK8_9ACTN|nr:helix-turn-helix domain-containing protein [Planosporangium flavigriseum]NJC67009.1 helix-turn-helix domain-containing protein [Planosporangium flavigriseum]GIG73922.1 hypothetical protein Pfl04_23260 [Planosporangium flavigriseum]